MPQAGGLSNRIILKDEKTEIKVLVRFVSFLSWQMMSQGAHQPFCMHTSVLMVALSKRPF